MVNISKARDLMADSLINMLNFTITIPLDAMCKNIHTNSFIKLNQELFKADYLWNIYKAMGKTSGSRWTEFRKNYWYVAETEVNYSKQTMKLKLLALPSVPPYKANDLDNKETKSSKKVTSGKTSSKKDTVSLKKPSWMKKSDQNFIVDIVKKAIGTSTKTKTMANKCIVLFNKKHVYSLYYDFDHGKNFKSTWNDRSLNCGDGAVCMANLLYTLGLSPKMHLGSAGEIGESYGHYWLEVNIDGKTYYVDHANCTGCGGRAKLRTSGTDYGHHPKAGSIVSWKP